MRKRSDGAGQGDGVTWAEMARRLKRDGMSVSRATVRKYQGRGLIPGPRPVGRAGKGPGVDWVWTQEQAELVIGKIKELRSENRTRRRLRRVSQKELRNRMYWLHKEAREVVVAGGYAYLSSVTPGEARDASLGAYLIECGLDNLDETLDRPGTILIIYAPDPEPAAPGGSDEQAS